MRLYTQVAGGVIATVLAMPGLAHELTLKVDNIKSIKGDLLVAVYASEENYNTNANWTATRKVKVVDTTIVLDFMDLPAGNYAIKLFQDENENGQIDKNTMGIPTEPYGFSNNGGSFGQPSFDEAKVVVDKATQVDIHLH